MGAVDFGEWAAPALQLTFGGRVYEVQPPTVDAAAQIMAAAVRGEVALGLVPGPVPDEVARVLAGIGDGHPALGDVYGQLAADGVPQATIDRMAYYAVFYWARGAQYADTLARLLWQAPTVEEAAPAPKGLSRRRIGRRMG